MVEMEMSILSQGAVEGDESEYVFIQGDDMDFDEESYDHCDLSPDLSCAASVCSGVTLGDFKDVTASMVSLEDRNDGESKDVKKEDEDVAMESAPARRLCNKKRRKKLKMLKKAAAAAHFEASRKVQEASAEDATPENSAPERGVTSKCKSRGKKNSNLAVVCAQETLAAYREETRHKKVNYVL